MELASPRGLILHKTPVPLSKLWERLVDSGECLGITIEGDVH
jgi:hypothetical protein